MKFSPNCIWTLGVSEVPKSHLQKGDFFRPKLTSGVILALDFSGKSGGRGGSLGMLWGGTWKVLAEALGKLLGSSGEKKKKKKKKKAFDRADPPKRLHKQTPINPALLAP